MRRGEMAKTCREVDGPGEQEKERHRKEQEKKIIPFKSSKNH